MKHQVSRRRFTKLAIGAAIVGFNPDERSWVTQSSNTARPFDRVPKLDGALLLDEESRRAIAGDEGNMFHRVPAAVLRPGSVDDIVTMVRYANQHKLKVAIRGHGHSRYGQTQAGAGLVIDSRSLNAVRVRTPQSADAQPGVLWSAVLDAALPKGLKREWLAFSNLRASLRNNPFALLVWHFFYAAAWSAPCVLYLDTALNLRLPGQRHRNEDQ